ncbi:MAG: glycosyltransferase family 39 protein, partial [candidate division Zixibacteria bacterium]|nr:glycosyltransferase family 39 protein [candidate division Zixibacteria bacterium]
MEYRSIFAGKERKQLAILLALSALLRGLYLFFYSQEPIWGDLIVDSLFHLNWADSIAGGNIIGDEVYFRAPLYVYFLAVVRSIFGEALMSPRVLGSLMGVFSIALTYFITRRISAESTGHRAALWAAGLQAIYPSFIYFEAELLTDFLFTLLLQLSLLCYLIYKERETQKFSALTGLCLGLAALTRPTALALAPLYLFLIWRNTQSSSDGIKSVIICAVVTVMTIAPVTARNYYVGGELTLVASSGGVNFFIGNNDSANPVDAALPEPFGASWTISDMVGLAEMEMGAGLGPAQVSDFWRNKGLEWISENPTLFLTRYLGKLGLVFSNTMFSNNRPLGEVFDNNPILRFSPIGFAAVLFLAVWGMSLNRTRRRRAAPLIAIAICYSLILGFFFINERFRLPVIVHLFPLAGLGCGSLLTLFYSLAMKKNAHEERVSSRSALIRPIVKGALWAGLALIFSLAPLGQPQSSEKPRALYLEGNGYLSAGLYELAKTPFRQALAEDPSYPRAALNLGVAFYLEGNSDSAEFYFKQELSYHPQNPEAHTNLASLKLNLGDIFSADSFSREALRIRPYDMTTFRVRLATLRGLGMNDSAGMLLMSGEVLFANDIRYWYERGIYSLDLGDPDLAKLSFKRAVDIGFESSEPVEYSDQSFTRG